jgi:putative tricarboxylic transport membrane protein
VIVAIGLFAVGEPLYVAARLHGDEEEIVPLRGKAWIAARHISPAGG